VYQNEVLRQEDLWWNKLRNGRPTGITPRRMCPLVSLPCVCSHLVTDTAPLKYHLMHHMGGYFCKCNITILQRELETSNFFSEH